MKKIKYVLAKFVIGLFGNVQFFRSPFFCLLWGNTHYKVRGDEARVILNKLRMGDVLLCRFDRYVSGWLIPGFWTHVALYVGKNKVIHARTKGVVEDDILTFLRTDYVAVLRFPVDKERRLKAVETARSFIGKEYDFVFDTVDDERLYCSELVRRCYPDVGDMGEGVIPPDRMLDVGAKVIHDSREWREKVSEGGSS